MNASELRSVLAGHVTVARQGSGKQRYTGSTDASTPRNHEAARIREWARNNGHSVSSRGRVNGEIVEAHRAARR